MSVGRIYAAMELDFRKDLSIRYFAKLPLRECVWKREANVR